MNVRLGLPTGLVAMGVTPGLFERVVGGAIANRCLKTKPRIATRGDVREMLAPSMSAATAAPQRT